MKTTFTRRTAMIAIALLFASGSAIMPGCKKDNPEENQETDAYEAVQVSGTITPPQGMDIDMASLTVNGGSISSATSGGSGQFTLNLNKNAVQLVTAVRENNIPVFLNIIVTPAANSTMVLNAMTTARSLVFLHPAAVVSDAAMADTIIRMIDNLPETHALAGLIGSKLQSKPDILGQEDQEIRSAVRAAVAHLQELVNSMAGDGSSGKSGLIGRFREVKHMTGNEAPQRPAASSASGDLLVSPAGPQSGLTVKAIKKSDNIYEIEVTNSKKRYVNLFLDDPVSGNIGSLFLPSIKSYFDWNPLASSSGRINATLDIAAHPSTVLYAYGLGALKHPELLGSPLYQDRILEPVIYTAVFDFLFPLVDVVSGVKGFKNSAPGSDPTGVMTFIINQMNSDISLKGQMIAHLESGNYSEMLATAVKSGIQVFIQNPTLILQYVKKRVTGAVLYQVLTPMLVAPLRTILATLSGMDVLTAVYGVATSAWLEKWTLSTGGMYDGTWTGTFKYTATIPQSSGPPEIVNTSFNLSITLVSTAAVAGFPQMLTVTGASCDDQTFGAVSPVVPSGPLSIALLPASFGSLSASGMGISIQFPNGSTIFTTNSPDGAFTVDAAGRVLSSTGLVSQDAFSAGGTVDNSNLPGSGPGGYAYNWCKFTSWSLVRQ